MDLSLLFFSIETNSGGKLSKNTRPHNSYDSSWVTRVHVWNTSIGAKHDGMSVEVKVCLPWGKFQGPFSFVQHHFGTVFDDVIVTSIRQPWVRAKSAAQASFIVENVCWERVLMQTCPPSVSTPRSVSNLHWMHHAWIFKKLSLCNRIMKSLSKSVPIVSQFSSFLLKLSFPFVGWIMMTFMKNYC